MNYLLVNHVPFFKGQAPGAYRLGDLWLEDLRAQATAVAAVGGRLTVATPLVEQQSGSASGSFNLIETTPAAAGFDYIPLPRYQSMRQYLMRRGPLRRTLRRAVAEADVVQMGYGGHPVGLGQVVFPIASRLAKQRIFVFDGADPFPRLEREAGLARNPLKRFVKRRMVTRFNAFCRRAVAQSELVFAHNSAVVERFADVWGPHCHQFDRSFATKDILIDGATLAAREAKLLERTRPLRLVVCGRQITIKATDHVLRAIAKARRLQANVELDIVGDGADLPQFIELSRELKIEPFVRVRGVVPYGQPLFDVWAENGVMVVTNLTAEISRNVLLSAARGLPIITYQNAGTDKLLTQADAGWIVERGNIDALAEAFRQADADRPRLVKYMRNARTLAETITLEATHRRRAELAAEMYAKGG